MNVADDKKEPWLNLLALTTVILAVCATLATFKGGGFSTRSVLRQNQASDQWAYYQAKSIKGNLYEMDREHLVREIKLLEGGKAEQCGWVKDRFGLVWQVNYAGLQEMVSGPDAAASTRTASTTSQSSTASAACNRFWTSAHRLFTSSRGRITATSRSFFL